MQKALGRRLARSLKTHDKSTAVRLAAVLWAHEWSRTVGGASSMKADEAEALFYAGMLKSAQSDAEREGLVDHIAGLASDRYEAATGEHGRQAALRFNKTANGKLTATATHIEAWLVTLPDKPATITAKRRVATLFADTFPYIEEVETRPVQAWLTETARVEKMATPTVDRLLSFSRGYWRYLMDIGVIETNPLRDVRRPAGARKVQSWLPFTPAQVVALRDAASENDDPELAEMIELGMWTGARIDELGGLKVEEVDLSGKSFKITEAKTSAGIREVPIHLRLLPTLKRLIGQRKSGYVLGRPREGTATRRSKAVGERFSTLKSRLGHTDRHVFHSIRKTVGTQLENAGVSENVAADIIGHEKPRITYGLYSGGASLQVKRAALAKLKYPS